MVTSPEEHEPAFEGVGTEPGLLIWRIENFRPAPVPKSSYGKFFMGDSYIVLKTTGTEGGPLKHDIHYWIGKDSSQEERMTAATLSVELVEALGGESIQHREVQGNESKEFLDYFHPCIITIPGGIKAGLKHIEINDHEHVTRLYHCKGRNVEEVPVKKSSLNHGDIFILDTQSKIYEFYGSSSSIQEKGKAIEVVQHIKDTHHHGSCEIDTIEDGEVADDAAASEFWSYLGGFGEISAATNDEDLSTKDILSALLYEVEFGNAVPLDTTNMTMDLLDTNKCYLLESGLYIYVWIGKGTSVADKKGAIRAAEELLLDPARKKYRVTHLTEGQEEHGFYFFFK